MKKKGLLILLILAFNSHFMVAQDATVTKSQVLFTNVNVFDGVSDKLMMKANVLIENNLIKQVSAGANSDNIKIIMKDGKIYKNTIQ